MEEIAKALYAEYSENTYEWMKNNNCHTLREVTQKLMVKAMTIATKGISDELEGAKMTIMNLKREIDSISENVAGEDL